MPQEIEVWYIIPYLRRELALALKEQGIKQSMIAQMLGITESAVSQYLKKKRGVVKGLSIKKQIVQSAKTIIKDFQSNNHIAMQELLKLCDFLKSEGHLCDIHRANSSKLDGCCVCMK